MEIIEALLLLLQAALCCLGVVADKSEGDDFIGVVACLLLSCFCECLVLRVVELIY